MSAVGCAKLFACPSGSILQEASKEEKNHKLDTLEDNMENEGVDQPHSSTKMSIGKAGEEPQALEPKVVEQDTRILYIRSAVERFVNCMFICMDQLVIEAVFQSQALNVQRLRVI